MKHCLRSVLTFSSIKLPTLMYKHHFFFVAINYIMTFEHLSSLSFHDCKLKNSFRHFDHYLNCQYLHHALRSPFIDHYTTGKIL
jgi:hypothetical protein